METRGYPASYPMGTRGSSLEVKRPGLEADHSPPSSAEVKNVWSCTSTPPICLHGVVLGYSPGTTLPVPLTLPLPFEVNYRVHKSTTIISLNFLNNKQNGNLGINYAYENFVGFQACIACIVSCCSQRSLERCSPHIFQMHLVCCSVSL
jgi:hypothetical protein